MAAKDVINMTGMAVDQQLLNDPCLGQPLVTGSALDLVVEKGRIRDILVSWMPAGERLALGIPLHPDRMERSDWEVLPGIGATMARRIDLDRQENGEFGSVAGLLRVPGVGKRRLEAWSVFFGE